VCDVACCFVAPCVVVALSCLCTSQNETAKRVP
jgi:hypothetical protein